MQSEFINRLIVVLSFAVTLVAFSSCNSTNKSNQTSFVVNQDSLGDWLIRDEVKRFSSLLQGVELELSTGLSKEDYLEIIENQVKVMQKYQDEQGRIIDPVEKKEMYYTTPCYAHSVAVLASSGYTQNDRLIESGMKALDNACIHLRNQFAPGNHGDFFTWPVVLAYRHFKAFADTARYNYWTESIAGIKPEKFYAYHRNYSLNWNLVHASGEFLRYKEGFTDIYYIDTCMYNQLNHFTDYGMYNEWGNPLAYDLFSRHYIAGMLALGYKGKVYDAYRVNSQKGAWMSLFMQSPFGEQPTGYRSSHHIWNEAEQAVLFEIYANQYALVGEHKVAGAFKRGAMLSLQSIKNWIRSDGSGYVVKNKFPIEKKHGYENYTAHSCYNMLATSMLAQAFEFANDEISEEIAPCDVGGYVLDLRTDFHKVIASIGGTYVEYDTRGDQQYNPTGLLRVHIKGSHPQLGPSDGCAQKFSGDGVSIASGPAWKKNETWHSLASQVPLFTSVEKLEENADVLSFQISQSIAQGQDTLLTHEVFTLSKGRLVVKNVIEGEVDSMRVVWPMLINNGASSSQVTMIKNGVKVELEDKQVEYEISMPEDAELQRSNLIYNHRNGWVEPIYYSGKTQSITYSISTDSVL